MKMKSVVLLVVALGCGLVAMLGVQQVMSGPTDAEQKPVNELQVLVATEKIGGFSSLDDSNTEFKAMPKGLVPEGAILSRSDYTDKKLHHTAMKGDIITAEKLIDKNFSPSEEIPPGMRVVTVKVNQTKIHSGLLQPGDIVDVVLTYKVFKPGRQPIQRTATVLQRVKVFAIDEVRLSTFKDEDGNDIKAKNVSLLATPSDGNLLMLAENAGQLTLALRNVNDTKVDSDIEAFTSDDLGRGKRGKSGGEDNGFGKFLTNRQGGQKQPEGGDGREKSDDADNQPPKWTMKIFNGPTARVVEVEDPNAIIPDKKKRATDKKPEKTPRAGTNTGA